MTFHQHSKEIVQEYLGTVAYVDDLIFSRRTDKIAEYLGNTEMREVAAKGSTAKDEGNKHPERQLNPNIDPLTFTNAFLKKGIHCALLEVTNEHDPLDSIKRILNKSDVIILDWQMHADLGRNACVLVESILSEDKDRSLSLRLLVIYTDQPVYNTLIRESIVPIFDRLGILYNVSETGTEIISGHTKIIVLQKPKLGIAEDGKISGEDLPEKIIEEMTLLTEGLVSNTALKAVTVIRRNSHNLLGAFNKDLDSAYLNHRAFLESPSDSELHMANWISDEMKDLLYVNKVSEEVNINNVKLRLHSYGIKEYSIFDKNGHENKKITDDLMINLLEKGCIEYNKKNNKNGKGIPLTWFSYFHKSFPKIRTDVNERFAVLSSLSSSSFNHNLDQLLTLGSIIKEDDSILVCIQPSCDSYRLKIETKFIFLKAVENAANFDLVIPNGKEFLKLSILYKSDNIVLIPFTPSNGVISSKPNGFGKIFEDAGSKKYIWLGNLKYQFAQRIVNEFAFQMSRVGLDESEWLRRWSER